MDIEKLPFMWLQSWYEHPYGVFVSDIKTDKGKVLVFDGEDQDHSPFFTSDENLFPTIEEANKNMEKKLNAINAVQSDVEAFYRHCSHVDKSNWIVKLVDRNSSSLKYANEKIRTLRRIIDTYHTGVMNIDGVSFRVKNIVSIKFGDKVFNKEAKEIQRKVLLHTNDGEEICITLHDEIDREYFYEFFGENNSGYVCTI